MDKEKYKNLQKSLKKHGQQYPIHRCKFGIIDGYKRSELLVEEQPSILDKTSRFIDHPEIETIEEYLGLIDSMQPVQMTSKEKHHYIEVRSKELKSKGVSAKNIIKILKRITGLSERQIYRIIPNDIKLEYKRLTNVNLAEERKISFSKQKLISEIRSKYQFLDEVAILKALNKNNLLPLLNAVAGHFTSIKKREVLSGSIDQLLEVTYSKLEENNFSKLDESSMRFWKFLAEEYMNRYKEEELNNG